MGLVTNPGDARKGQSTDVTLNSINTRFTNLYNEVNGLLSNPNFSPTAAIDESKIALFESTKDLHLKIPTGHGIKRAAFYTTAYEKKNISLSAPVASSFVVPSRINNDGTLSTTEQPWGLAYDEDRGVLWQSSRTREEIYQVNTLTGAILSSFDVTGIGPRDVAYDRTDLWVIGATTNRIYRYNTAGTIQSSFTPASADPSGLTAFGGSIWYSGNDSRKIYRTNTLGTLQGVFNFPTGTNLAQPLGLGDNGESLFAVDKANSTVYKLNTAGTTLSSYEVPTFGETASQLDISYGYFDGSSYITSADSDDWFFNGDFAIDFRIRFNQVNYRQGVVCQTTDYLANGWAVVFSSVSLFFQAEGSTMIEASGLFFNLGQWYHFEIDRNGNDWYIFRDGTLLASGTNATALSNVTSALEIGRTRAGGFDYPLNADIEELRITKGASRHTAAFTSPFEEYTDDGNTVSLLHFNGVDQSTDFIDSHSPAHTYTRVGNPVIRRTAEDPTLNSIRGIDYDGSHLWMLDFNSYFVKCALAGFERPPLTEVFRAGDGGEINNPVRFSTKDHLYLNYNISTIGSFAAYSIVAAAFGYTHQIAFKRGTDRTVDDWYITHGTRVLRYRRGTFVSSFTLSGVTDHNRLAFGNNYMWVYDRTVGRFYQVQADTYDTDALNGVALSSFNFAPEAISAIAYADWNPRRHFLWAIGDTTAYAINTNNGTAINSISFSYLGESPKGALSLDAESLWIANGVRLYRVSTDSTARFLNSFSLVSGALDASNGGIGWDGRTIWTAGRGSPSGASGDFDGSGDYLSTPDHADFDLAGALTVEFFVKLNNTTSHHGFFTSGGGVNDWIDAFWHYVDNRIEWQFEGENHRWSWTPSANTWYHVAFVRDGANDLKVYVDGAALTLVVGDGNNATALSLTNTMLVGRGSGTSAELNGLMDEFRISNIARYAGAFTPTTTAFTDDGNTIVLLHMDGNHNSTTFTDSHVPAKTFTANGNVHITTADFYIQSGGPLFAAALDSHIGVIAKDIE